MFNQLHLKFHRAFTLVELIIVIVIVGILAAISIVGYQSVVDRVDQAAAETTLASVDREYRALAAFNIAADSSAGVPIADMTAIDGIDYSNGDADGDGLLEPGETVTFDGVVLTLSAATTPGSIAGNVGTGGSGGSGAAFSVSYNQQSFDPSGSSEDLSPSVAGSSAPVTYSYTGSLPTGVSFDTATGTFTGAVSWNSTATAVATGVFHSCAILADTSVECWGDNTSNQAPAVASVSNAVAVTAGFAHSCALVSGGNVQCWGDNTDGQLNVPSSVSGAAIAVAAGLYHNCAVLGDGSVECWGDNTSNQAPAVASVSDAVAVTAGFAHSCALSSDDVIRCWGSYNNGPAPTAAPVSDPIAVASGAQHTCALISGGSVECWGNNAFGQAPAFASVSNAVAISAGNFHSCALDSAGEVTCWGASSNSQNMGHTTMGGGISAVNSGGNHNCALITNGSIECWGDNSSGQAPTAVPGFGNPGFPASVEVTATSGSETSVVTVNLSVS